MTVEISPYEGQFDDLNGKACLGRVVEVNQNTRRCRVKTLGLKGWTDDLDLFDVQWSSSANHPDGDEDTFLPRIGQLAVVLFINSEPYIVGFFQPIQSESQEPRPEKEPLRPGDRIMKTVSGNKFILRSGGSVEIESTKLCRTFWLPTRNRINTVCQNWELEADGGRMFWTRQRGEPGNTIFRLFCFEDVTSSFGTELQLGKTEDDAILSLKAGSLNPRDGSFTSRNFAATVDRDGNTKIDIGPGKITIEYDAASGNITSTVEGNLTQTVNGNLVQTVAGDANITANGLVDIVGSEIQLNGSSGKIITTATDPVVDNITGFPHIGVPTVLAG